MTPENLTPIIALFDERFNELKKELKESQKEYISLIERTYNVKIDGLCKDMEEIKNSDDHKELEDRLGEKFMTKMDMLLESIKSFETAVTKEQSKIDKRLDEHDGRIVKLESAEAERARKLLQKIKDNALAWIVPTLLIALAIILGINIPGLGK